MVDLVFRILPIQAAIVKKMNLFSVCHPQVRMVLQRFRQCCRAAFLNTGNEEINSMLTAAIDVNEVNQFQKYEKKIDVRERCRPRART